MSASSPARTYYTSLTGRWRGTFSLRVTRSEALRGMPLLTQLVALAARFGGRATMVTTLREEAPHRFQHTTQVSRLGLPLLRSDETITLQDDGRSFVIEGWQQFLWHHEPYRAEGHVADDALGAHYPITWLRAPMTQTTRIETAGGEPCLRLRQETNWSAGEVLLERQP